MTDRSPPRPVRGVLVRVGIDHSYGAWNAPADRDTGDFVYVPIPEYEWMTNREGLERTYAEVTPHLQRFGDQFHRGDAALPNALRGELMHLDPDFGSLTYGDDGRRRGSGIAVLKRGDLVVFYAGLRASDKLIYGLIGLFRVAEVMRVSDVPPDRYGENAHTRRTEHSPDDIIVRADPEASGRLERLIDIGEWRDRAYRVQSPLLDAWGGLSVKDGFIQRSARPPSFTDPERFYSWFKAQEIPLLQRNN